ncbi:MAG: hypothetical protein EBT97_09605 [Actinobacteria bacterium]|jgi:hypothetical protein|nr:hypothetical protein [Actinomycetota bacterium]
MPFASAQVSRLYVGLLNFSGYTRSYSHQYQSEMLDVTVLTSTSKEFIPGQESATFSADMLLDNAATATSQFGILYTAKSTPQVVTLAPSGTTRGAETWQLLANETNFSTTAPVADVVSAAVQFQADGLIDPGVILDPETAITIDTNGTSVDNTAATSNGGVAHLHVTAYSGLTSNSIIIEHSTNNSTWTTLATFTLVTGTGSERLVIAAGTTVNRYLRIRDDVTGTGSCTRFVSFARR